MTEMDPASEKQKPQSCGFDKQPRATRKKQGPAFYGAMYRRELQSGFWPSQRALAEAFSVSNAHVSRCIAIADLPTSVFEAFGGKKYVSFRLGRELLKLSRELGEPEMRRRALKVKFLQLAHRDEILQFLMTGDAPASSNARLSIVVERGRKAIRIGGSDVEKLSRNLDLLKTALRACVKDINLRNNMFAAMAAGQAPVSVLSDEAPSFPPQQG